jgi:alpha-beta hydrolase superfamily lysophospholipase
MSFRPAVAAPAIAGVEHTESAFLAKDNTGLYEQAWRPQTGAPKAVLVIMHGLKDHSARYAELATRLVAKNWAVHAFDLRGHAHSEGERVYVESFDDYVDDLEVFTKRVQAQEPGKPIFLLGHSMGGAIVTLYVLEHRTPPLNGIVLSAPALRANVGAFKKVGTKLANALTPHAGVFNLDVDAFSRDPKVVQECKDDPFVYQDGAPAHTAKELLKALGTISDRMEEITVPFLVMHGQADTITDPTASQDLSVRAASKDKTLKLYPNLVHDLLHEPEKATVMSDVEAWLEARTKP